VVHTGPICARIPAILDDVEDEETSAAVKARAEQIWEVVISYRQERRETYI
jgi:hypothetical protein